MNDHDLGSFSHWVAMLVGSSICVLGAKYYMPEVYWILDFIRSYSVSHFFLVALYVMIPVSITHIIVILGSRFIDPILDELFSDQEDKS